MHWDIFWSKSRINRINSFYGNKNDCVLCLVQFKITIYLFFFTLEDIAFTQQIQKEQAERVDDIDNKLTKTQGEQFYLFKSGQVQIMECV